MSSKEFNDKYKSRIRELETQLSELKFELKGIKLQLDEEKEKQTFYQLIADFTFG